MAEGINIFSPAESKYAEFLKSPVHVIIETPLQPISNYVVTLDELHALAFSRPK